MAYLISFFLFSIGFYLHHRRKTWVAPDVLYCYEWGFITFLASLRLFSLYSAGIETWMIILIGSIAYLIGVGTSDKIAIKSHENKNLTIYQDSFMKNRLFWIFTNIFYFIGFIGLFRVIRMLFTTSITLDQIRLASYGIIELDGYAYQGGGILDIVKVFLTAIKTILIATGVQIFLTNISKNTKYIIAVTGLVIIESFTDGGRFGLAYLMIEIYVGFSFYSRYLLNTRRIFSLKAKRLIQTIIILLLMVIIIITILRGASFNELAKKYYRYLCGNIIYLDRRVKILDSGQFYSFTFAGLYGFWSIFLPIIVNLFGISYPSLYLSTIERVMDTQTYYMIGQNMTTNAFVTPFYHLYADFRWIGIIFGMFCFGLIVGIAFKRAKICKSRHDIILYLIIAQMIFKTLHAYPLVNPSYVVILIIFYLNNKRIKI